ncbi:MAG: archaeosortase/exosortase family protein [cyanobacterium endosymbiont of Rhopalodia fuxianensis]
MLLDFVTHVIKVFVIAVLVVFPDGEAFEYLHQDAGNLVFFLASVLIFWIFY